ncbi:MAG TPA: Bcr/CflA family multidrug efflux MFS transporter [Stellaceae bacterium]|nr:Bcr/CflA family multidrug efflux MFS transporter [Stellaceae bacterium]
MFARLAAGSRPNANDPMFIAALAVLMTFGPMAIDMYLPALTSIAGVFHATQDQVQWSLSAFFLGFGIGQIVWGALSDWLGRRIPVMVGIALYGIGCVGCSLAPDIAHLAVWRFVQALGACAGPVLARAMVRDAFGRDRAASVLSLMMLVMGIAPMVAPLVGGQILIYANWRTIFWVQAAFGIVALLGVMSLPETLARGERRELHIGHMAQAYLRLLTSRQYLGYALSSAMILGAMFAYISGSPFVYIEYFKVRPENYGFLFGVNIVAMIIVNTLNSQLVMRFGTDRMMRIGCVMSAVFGIALLAVAMTGFGGLFGIAATLFLFLGMNGMVGANGMAGAMSSFPYIAGSASALAGMLQFASGALAGSAVGALANGTPIPMAAVICGTSIAGAALNIALVRRAA